METKTDSSAQTFVDSLLTEGAKIKCDETSESFTTHKDLPPFYDEELFKKGQQFFYKHIFAFFVNKCLGLVAVLAVPSILRILMFTKMSNTCVTSYRRYMATIFHMMVWYDSDFKPGSRLWRSIEAVRDKHNSASRRGCTAGLVGITQKDMALTQFGFMGIALTRSKYIGIHEGTEEEWRAFLHVWRVVGYLMGIEDRFNLCSGTVEETRQICDLLIDQVFRPHVEQKDKDFLAMSSYMVNGLWSMSPMLKFESIMCYLHALLQTPNGALKPTYMPLNFSQYFSFRLGVAVAHSLRWSWWRIYHNYTKIVSLWLMKVFPFLGYYQFGYANSHVYILDDDRDK
ncbi:hypothetical protein NQ318_018750 [Aromia moschata]|uniref:ER-bound oxygenase mpaB/mpaB'/Rubber oxygenase catalytic domain-containing protein n=1 Tax=Aromia moschata TaxID=1265417 RepID=A0AAV8ZGE9_9CUCU|nr:hypothetical protein NQ318_018750 [Aromia moschata]